MRVIISGGGTAGHINPALAVAQQLKEKGHEVLFVGAEGKMEMDRVPREGFPIVGLPVAGIQRKLTLRNLSFPFKLLKSIRKSRKILKLFTPDVVVGFGGYASAPIVLAAQKRGIRTVIQEQNSYAGLANKRLAKKADRICVAYENMERFFPSDKIVLTGNPLRNVLHDLPSRDEACKHFEIDPSKKIILLLGGSLGTRSLNEVVLALKTLPNDVQMIWQCGSYYYEEMKTRATTIEPRAFIERMDMAYAAADMVITRAGASTVSELQLIGKPTIFVPSPNVAEDHQTVNAMSLVNVGAAMMVKDAEAMDMLLPTAIELLSQSEKMVKMADRQRSMGRPHATEDIVKIILQQ